jgi:thymidylate synthase (FAD)
MNANVNPKLLKRFGNDIVFIDPFLSDSKAALFEWERAMLAAEKSYFALIRECGCTPQQARSVLPNSTKTTLVCTANLREWRYIFYRRTGKTDTKQMQALMGGLLRQMQSLIPVVFDNIIPAEK